MKTKSSIRNRFAQAVMTLLVTLLSTVTAWAQTSIEGLTYNETDGCYGIRHEVYLPITARRHWGDENGKTQTTFARYRQTINIPTNDKQ